jgi:hypothetical protein
MLAAQRRPLWKPAAAAALPAYRDEEAWLNF